MRLALYYRPVIRSAMALALAALALGVWKGAAGASPGSSAAPAPPHPTSLTGIYVAKVAGKSPARLNGTWYLTIEGDVLYVLQKKGVGVVITGNAAFSGRKMTFQKESGPGACKGSQAVGRYTWGLKGKTLTFHRLADTCALRRTILGVPMTKLY